MLLQKNTDVSYTDYTRKNGNNNYLRVSNLGHKRLVILNIKQGSFINISGSTPMYESPATRRVADGANRGDIYRIYRRFISNHCRDY